MYSGSIWGSASPSQIKRIQTFQNRCLRLITNAPWYIRNSTLHTDLQVPDVTTTLRQNYLNLQNTFVNHRNPLVQQILQNYPPHPINRRLKRKWHSDLRLWIAAQQMFQKLINCDWDYCWVTPQIQVSCYFIFM